MANNPLPQVCFDSCVIIDYLQKTAGYYDHVAPIVKDAFNGQLTIVVSTVAIAEVIKLDGPPLSIDHDKMIKEFFAQPYVYIEAAGIIVSEHARDIRRKHKVDIADSLHIGTAFATKTPIFLTRDGDKKPGKKCALLKEDKKITIDGICLRIQTAEDYLRDKEPLLAALPTPKK